MDWASKMRRYRQSIRNMKTVRRVGPLSNRERAERGSEVLHGQPQVVAPLLRMQLSDAQSENSKLKNEAARLRMTLADVLYAMSEPI